LTSEWKELAETLIFPAGTYFLQWEARFSGAQATVSRIFIRTFCYVLPEQILGLHKVLSQIHFNRGRMIHSTPPCPLLR